jgi:hypothetical protein
MLDDKTTLNLIMIITAIGTVTVQAISAWRTPTKKKVADIEGITKIIRDRAEQAVRQNDEIKVQTNGNHKEIQHRLDQTENENRILRERLISLAQLIPSPMEREQANAKSEMKEALADAKAEGVVLGKAHAVIESQPGPL